MPTHTISPAGIPSAEHIGVTTVDLITFAPVTIGPVSIGLVEDFGDLTTIGGEPPSPQDPDLPPKHEKFDIVITTLHYPPNKPAKVVARLLNYTNAEVNILYNDKRDAKVTISIYDRALGELGDNGYVLDEYFLKLHIKYRDHPVIWGIITQPEWDGEAGTVTISCVDDGLRLEDHFLVIGDLDIGSGNPDAGKVSIDFRGLRALRDAANNLDIQTARGVPDLGIKNGHNYNSTSDHQNKIQRGDQVWKSMQDVTQFIDGPDFELEPLEIADSFPYYARLNTFSRQGHDKSTRMVFHYGWGRNNLANLKYSPGGKLSTHAHVASADNKVVVSVGNAASSALRGVYVEWAATQWSGSPVVLKAWGDEILRNYSLPPKYFELVMRLDSELPPNQINWHYPEDYAVGDTIRAIGKKGHFKADVKGRITKVTLKQENESGLVRPEVTVIPDQVDQNVLNNEEA